MTLLAQQLANRCAALETDLGNLLVFAQQNHAVGPIVDRVRDDVAALAALMPELGLPDVRRAPVRWGYADHLLVTNPGHVGFGDVIEPLAIVPELAANAGMVTLAVLKPMIGLVQDSTAYLGNVRVGDETPTASKTTTWLKLRLDPMYKRPHGRPFLRAVPGPCDLPEARLARSSGALHIGIAWKSHHETLTHCRRSAPLAVVAAPLLELGGGVVLHSLQPDRAHECHGTAVQTHVFTDFRASARLVCRLDCVVSIDAAAAHLAAGLGVPTFCIVGPGQDGRWEKTGSRSAWYGSMHVVHTPGFPRTSDDPNGIRAGAVQCAELIRAGTFPPRLPFAARQVGPRKPETGTAWQLLRKDLERLVFFAALERISPNEAGQMMQSFQAFATTARGLAA